ncbi:hypothetical protein [Sorangium sp. So ce1335]|uniref:hypothetical protein n=1 Tax=Sorangium sp. So ce1335 TaxID=3133335 RepID=UPI003F5E6F39
MLTQARGRTGVALLLFILVIGLAADRLAALPAEPGGAATQRTPPGAEQADRLPPGARGALARPLPRGALLERAEAAGPARAARDAAPRLASSHDPAM